MKEKINLFIQKSISIPKEHRKRFVITILCYFLALLIIMVILFQPHFIYKTRISEKTSTHYSSDSSYRKSNITSTVDYASDSDFLYLLEHYTYKLGLQLSPECIRNIQYQFQITNSNAFHAGKYSVYLDDNRMLCIEFNNHIYITNYFCIDRPIRNVILNDSEYPDNLTAITEFLDDCTPYWIVDISIQKDLVKALQANHCQYVDSSCWYDDTAWLNESIDALDNTANISINHSNYYFSYNNSSLCLEGNNLVCYSLGEKLYFINFPHASSILSVTDKYILFNTTFGYTGSYDLIRETFLFSITPIWENHDSKILYTTLGEDGLLYLRIKDFSSGEIYANVANIGFSFISFDGQICHNTLSDGSSQQYFLDWDTCKLIEQ